MSYTVSNAGEKDLPFIYHLFEEAIRFQQLNQYIGWKSYDKAFLQSDIANGLLFKITSGNDIVCIFSICFSDELIWREKEKGNAVYLHRIVLNRELAREKMFGRILLWAIDHSKRKHLEYIRMDTWADNEKLISYYKDHGFRLIEYYRTASNEDLPVQHRDLRVALLEKKVE